MSGIMGTSKNDAVVDNDSSIREECEDLVACDNSPPASSGFFASKFRGIMERMASRPWGQVVFKSFDRVLWCIERTLIWQNPDKVSLVPMDRPVNVVLAYPLAAFLWILQHLLFSTASTSSAIELIKWVQTRRRRLRAIRFQGIRNMRGKHILARPGALSRFYQIFWFFGTTPSDSKLQVEVTEKDVVKEVERIEDDLEDSEHNKKRRFSALSVSADEGTIFLDDEYNSESDSDYVPECSLSSESSDSDLSSVDEDETEDGNNPNESVIRDAEPTEKSRDAEPTEKSRDAEPTEKQASSQKTNGEHPTPKE